MLASMSYPGGKAGDGVYQRIINLMPPHRVYIEPFLGGAAILRMKRPASLNVAIDRDPHALEAVRLPARLAGMTMAGGSMSAAIVKLDERRRRGKADLAGGSAAAYATSGGGGLAGPSGASGEVRSTLHLFEGDGISFLETYRFEGHELVYCDPPYLLSTRTRRLYQYEMSDVDHRRLLRACRLAKCRVMISGYSSVLYARELKDWHAMSFPSMTRGGTERAEWLWYNFDRPVELHDYRYLGSDFREREQIKRQKRRWQLRLQRMPILRRQALLSAIADIAGTGEPRVSAV
jgi:DNA adenine methylase